MLFAILGLGFATSCGLVFIIGVFVLMSMIKKAASNPTVQKGAVEWAIYRLFK